MQPRSPAATPDNNSPPAARELVARRAAEEDEGSEAITRLDRQDKLNRKERRWRGSESESPVYPEE